MDVTLPEDLTTLTDDELGDLLNECTSEFDKLHDAGNRDVAALTELADTITALKGERKRREDAASADDEAIAALAERVHADDTDAPDDPDGGEGDGEGTEEAEGEGEAETPAEAEADKEPVTASATGSPRRPAARDVARRATRPRVPAAKPTVTITAAADVPGLAMNSHITVLDVAAGFHSRARALNDGSPRVPVARVDSPWPMKFTVEGEQMTPDQLRDLQGNDTAEALVASGGWCVPSTPILTLFEIGDAADLIDLPTVNVTGGMLVPSFFGFGDTAGALWNWTEAQDIAAVTQPAGPDKPCLKLPCPTWTECRLEAEGLCVTHGNLSDRAYPALTRSFVNTVMAAHQHRLSAAKIAKIVAGATNVVPDASMLVSDAAGDLLGMLALQAADLRSQYRAARTRTVEVLLPNWTIDVLRENVAKRAGVDLLSVSDAEVVGWLTNRNIRPQFLSDYQPLYTTAAATKWPANIEFTMYFAGAYIAGDGGEIDLGVVRDSGLNSTNDFTAAWSEQFFQVCRVGPLARKASVALTPDGVTACCA